MTPEIFFRIVPYLSNPWVLCGLVLFLLAAFCSLLITHKIFPPLNKKMAGTLISKIINGMFALALIAIISGLILGLKNLSNNKLTEATTIKKMNRPQTTAIQAHSTDADSPTVISSKIKHLNAETSNNGPVTSTNQSGGITAGVVNLNSVAPEDRQRLSQQYAREYKEMMSELHSIVKRDDVFILNSAKESYPISDQAIVIINKHPLATWESYLAPTQLESVYKFQKAYQLFKAAAEDFDNSLQQFIRAHNYKRQRHYVNDGPAIKYCLGRFAGASKEKILQEYRSNVEGTDGWVEDTFIEAKTNLGLKNKADHFIELRSKLKQLANDMVQNVT